MRNKNLSVLFCTVLFASLALAVQQAETTPVTIQVSDQTGAGIAHAQVRIVPSPDQAPAKLETDDHGQLSIKVKAGSYTVSVSAQGFKNTTQHVDVGPTERFSSGGRVVSVLLPVGDVSSPVPVYPRDTLVLTSDSDHAPVELSPADFHALPHISVTVHNGHSNAPETYSGVALVSLLEKVSAPVGKELHGEAMTSYVIATGSDGYSVVLSLAEIDPSFHACQVIVADSRDGQQLGKNGPFQLVVSDDKRPARWVHNLESVTLRNGR